jgi:uncharacterized protein (TIGR02246 family)
MAKTPEQTIDQADEAFNRGDLNAVLEHYEENAVWVVKPGHIASGDCSLRKEFKEIFRSNPQVIKEKCHVIECGDLALCSIGWRLNGTAAEGAPLNEEGFATTILRRQANGHWKIVIDNPWGSAILDEDGVNQ